MGQIDTFAAYYNARLRAMRSELFTPAQLDDLIDRDDFQYMTSVLLNSPYKVDLAEALTLYQGTDALEDAVSRNMVKVFQKLLSLAQGDYLDVVRVFLARWDLGAVKSLIRNRHHGLGPEAGRHSVFPGPKLTVAVINHLSSLETMEELITGLASWNPALCRGLRPQLARYRETNRVSVFEDALDRAYFVGNVRELGRRDDENSEFLRKVLQMEIDRINLRTLFQLRAANVSADDVMKQVLPMGSLSPKLLYEMAAAPSLDKAIELLGATKYHRLVEVMYVYIQTGRFSPLERMMERLLIEWLKRHARVRVLTIAVVMNYVWLKYNEAMNLRMIALGEARHLPHGRVREEVFYA